MTGRPRRVGWFDAVPLRYAVAVNSVSSIMLNKLDILSGIDPIRLCVAYELDGRRVESWPSSGAALARATPIYEEFPGWAEPINGVRSLADLPGERPALRSAIEDHAGVPIVLVSVGPERTQTIERAWRPMRHRAGTRRHEPPIMPTRILIVGGGGREHALAWKLAGEPGVNEVTVAPGSDCDRARAARPVRSPGSIRSTRRRSSRSRAGSRPSSSSSGPRRRSRPAWPTRSWRPGFAVFGPTAAAARIETSKAFCHEVASAGRACAMARSGLVRRCRGRRAPSPRSWPRPARASWSRRTGWRPARA